jgi:hypothetical protein
MDSDSINSDSELVHEQPLSNENLTKRLFMQSEGVEESEIVIFEDYDIGNFGNSVRGDGHLFVFGVGEVGERGHPLLFTTQIIFFIETWECTKAVCYISEERFFVAAKRYCEEKSHRFDSEILADQTGRISVLILIVINGLLRFA